MSPFDGCCVRASVITAGLVSLWFAPLAHAAGHSCFIERVAQAPEGLRLYVSDQAGSQLIVKGEGAAAPSAIYHADRGKLLRTDADEAAPQDFLLLKHDDRLSMIHGPHDICTVTVASHGGRTGVLASTRFTPHGLPSSYQEEFIPSEPAK